MRVARQEAVRLLSQATSLPEAQVASLLADAPLERGEFAFPCFTLGKERKQPPPEVAAQVAAAVRPGALIAQALAQGPYVNLRVDRGALARRTLDAVARLGERFGHEADADAAAPSAPGARPTVVVDYSSPNVAKPLAFHHLRSTMIGNSLVRLYRAGGWKVVGINHLGDWGTAFGKLLLAHELYGAEIDLDHLDIEGLNALYVRVNTAMAEAKQRAQAPGATAPVGEDGPTLEARARAWFKRLEDGDPGARQLWRRFVDLSLAEYAKVYSLLGVSFDHVWGEAFYEDQLPALIRALKDKDLLVESEGAQVVMLTDANLPPCLILKEDGASLYATRDLAAAIYRHRVTGFSRALYVIDRGQAVHVQQFRRVLEMMGHAWAAGIVHVAFGVVRMGGKKTKTRSGSVVLLTDVLDASVSKVTELIREKNPDLEDAERIARDVGIGAVVFNDLKNFRENDVDFDLDAITSFEGKTGPYVMYSHARACSILRRGREEGAPSVPVDPGLLRHDAEHGLVRLVAQFPDRVQAARESNDPSQVAKHVLDLADAFHGFHTAGSKDRALRVLTDEAPLRCARLALTDAVRQTMANGLDLLGIAAPPAM